MCCFFGTAVTSFRVKSHSHNRHLCVEEPGQSRSALSHLPRNHINSSGTCETQKNLPGCWSGFGTFQSIIAAVMFVDMRPVLCQALCCLSSFKMAVIYIQSMRSHGGMSCYFSPLLHFNSLDACCS